MRQIFRVFIGIAFVTVLGGCQAFSSKYTNTPTNSGPYPEFDSHDPRNQADVEIDLGPDAKKPRQKRELPKNITLVIGPGGAGTLASAGLIRLIEEKGYKLNHIIGLGWGGLVGGIYAKSKKLHEVDWQFYKIKEQNLYKKTFLGRQTEFLDKDKTQSFLGDIFKNKKANDLKLGFDCVPINTGPEKNQKEQTVQSRVFNCLNIVPFFEVDSVKVDSESIQSQVQQLLTQFDADFVIYADHLFDLENENLFQKKVTLDQAQFWQNLRSASQSLTEIVDFVVSFSTKEFPLDDFSNLKSILSKGYEQAKTSVDDLEKAMYSSQEENSEN